MDKNLKDAVITTVCTIVAMAVAYLLIVINYD
jgi:hypothetical protein